MGMTGSKSNEDVAGKVKTLIEGNPVVIFSKTWCPYCQAAEGLLRQTAKSSAVKVVHLDTMGAEGQAIQTSLLSSTGQRTVPNVFIGGRHIGGNDNIQALHRRSQFARLLADAGAAL